jgi:hypothetical protein
MRARAKMCANMAGVSVRSIWIVTTATSVRPKSVCPNGDAPMQPTMWSATMETPARFRTGAIQDIVLGTL